MKTLVNNSYIGILTIAFLTSSAFSNRDYVSQKEIDRPLISPKYYCQSENDYLQNIYQEIMHREYNYDPLEYLLMNLFVSVLPLPPSYSINDKFQFFLWGEYSYIRFALLQRVDKKDDYIFLSAGPGLITEWIFTFIKEIANMNDFLTNPDTAISSHYVIKSQIGLKYKQKLNNSIWITAQGYAFLDNVYCTNIKAGLGLNFQLNKVFSIHNDYLMLYDFIKYRYPDVSINNYVNKLNFNLTRKLSTGVQTRIGKYKDENRLFVYSHIFIKVMW